MLDLLEGVFQGLDTALHVRLDDEVEILHLAGRDARVQVVQGEGALLGERFRPHPR